VCVVVYKQLKSHTVVTGKHDAKLDSSLQALQVAVRMGEARHSRLNRGYFQRLNITVNHTLCAKVSAKTVS